MSFFLAVDLDDAARAQVAQRIALERERCEARWLRPEKLHLTLVFLGDPALEVLAGLAAVVAPVAARCAPFELALSGAGTFVTARAPSVLWLGVTGALPQLHTLVRPLREAVGLELDRTYTPHVTLARARTANAFVGALASLEPFRTAPFRVDRVVLYESAHDRYRRCFEVPLGKA